MKQQAKLGPRIIERLDQRVITSWQMCLSRIGRYAFAGQFVKNKTVLDIACGAGYGSSYLLSKGAKIVTGGDISEETIEYAKARYRKDNLNFLPLDAQQRLPFADSSFDVVVSTETIEHLENHENFLAECRRVMKSGGTFICSTPNKEAMPLNPTNPEKPSNPYHVKEYSVNEFQQLFSKYFKNVDLYGYIHHKERGIRQKLIGVIESLVYSLPEVLQTAVIKVVAVVTTVIFHQYHPVIFEDIDEEDFDKILTADFRPFPIEDTLPVFIFAVGEKQ